MLWLCFTFIVISFTDRVRGYDRKVHLADVYSRCSDRVNVLRYQKDVDTWKCNIVATIWNKAKDVKRRAVRLFWKHEKINIVTVELCALTHNAENENVLSFGNRSALEAFAVRHFHLTINEFICIESSGNETAIEVTVCAINLSLVSEDNCITRQDWLQRVCQSRDAYKLPLHHCRPFCCLQVKHLPTKEKWIITTLLASYLKESSVHWHQTPSPRHVELSVVR